jgi:uncharacterized spore protein YtfJ
MDAQQVLAQAREVITVKRVFGEPIERDGTTVVPVARVMGGSGFGSGWQPNAHEAGPEAAGEAVGGTGAGYGLWATPAGVYVIRAGEVRWQPAVSPERIMLTVGLAAFLVSLGVRGIVRVLRRG